MRFYAITDSIQVMSTSRSHFDKMVSFFNSENITSITPKKAKTHFYSTNHAVQLFEHYGDALVVAATNAANRGLMYGEELYPNRHLLYATPIFTVELPDNFKSNTILNLEINFKDAYDKKVASQLNITDISTRSISSLLCEKKDILNLIAVEIPHPNFKKHYVEIDAPVSSCNPKKVGI